MLRTPITTSTPLQRQIQLPESGHAFLANMANITYLPAPTSISPVCAPVTLPPDVVALPGTPTVEGVPIAADATPVSLPGSGSIDVAWDVVGPGNATLYGVTVYELKIVSDYTVPHLIASLTTANRSVRYDAALFAPGHSYVIQLSTTIGLNAAAIGDFVTHEYPVASATAWPHYFTLQ